MSEALPHTGQAELSACRHIHQAVQPCQLKLPVLREALHEAEAAES